MKMSQITSICSNITKATDIPLIVDADTGYGNALNVIRTVQELETAGVSCIQLEDQITPKHCGHFPGSKPVVPINEQLGKLKAALDTRKDDNLLIIARTDAAAEHGIEEAIKRATLFNEVGADLTFIEIEGSAEDFENISRNVPGRYATTVDESRAEPAFTVKKLGEMESELFEEFFKAFAKSAEVNLHIENLYGKNNHHIIESCFKAFARSIKNAIEIDKRNKHKIPSSKGIL